MSHATYLGQKGYSIYKKTLSVKEQIAIRDDLTVRPYIPKAPVQPTPYPIYLESTKKFYMPREYGLNTFGPPDEIKIGNGAPITLKFNGELREPQQNIINKFVKSITDGGYGGLLDLHTGFGKCLGKDTPVLMYDGHIKMVQDILVNDLLMGDDSGPRLVQSLARGKEMMYKIIPHKGTPYIVNESHILSLYASYNYKSLKYNKNYTTLCYAKGQIIDISVKDYLDLPKTVQRPLLGYKVGITYRPAQVDFDPYLFGYWLGDGHSYSTQITTQSPYIIKYMIELFRNDEYSKHQLYLIYKENYDYNICSTLKTNYFRTFLKTNRLIDDIIDDNDKDMGFEGCPLKHIPHNYKCNSREIQLSLLAGIIDSDGYNAGNCIELTLKNETLFDDVLFICHSLGFAAYKKQVKKTCMYTPSHLKSAWQQLPLSSLKADTVGDLNVQRRKNEKREGTYYQMCIHGLNLEQIPCLVPRKKCTKRLQIKNSLLNSITIEKLEINDYYGFTIDGNHRFLLGDYTVTHNTVMGLKIIAELKVKTLIIVHKGFLVDQWIERIQQFLPEARVGKIQGQIIDIDDKDIVIGMLQSLSMKDYPEDQFIDFGLTIIDECFPFSTLVHTSDGVKMLGILYINWFNNIALPDILSFNQQTEEFEYKKLTHAWRKERTDLLQIKMSKRQIKCTPEHKVLTVNGYVEANKLVIGDIVLCKYQDTQTRTRTGKNHNQICRGLNDDQLQIIYGSYLGSGHIGHCKIKTRYILSVSYGERDKVYGVWQANMLGAEQNIKMETNENISYTFSTDYFDLQNKLPRDSKIVPEWLIDVLDVRGIAVWYMDSGYMNYTIGSSYMILFTSNFGEDMQQLFINKFKTFGINCSTKTFYKKCFYLLDNKRYYLVFDQDNSVKFWNLISPYIVKINNTLKLNSLITAPDNSPKYIWNNKFHNYGTLAVTGLSTIVNDTPHVYDIEVADNHNFVIAHKRDNIKDNYMIVDGPVVSNCHHIAAETFVRALQKIVTMYILGLSATMNRKDGLSNVFKLFIGDIIHKERRDDDQTVLIKAVEFNTCDAEFNQIEYDFRGNAKYSTMITKLCSFNMRSELIIKILIKELELNKDQQIMILAHNKNLLTYLYKAIEHRSIATVGYYIGGMKQKDLKISETKQIVIATYSMASEGLDIKTLTTLILATPKTDVEQAVGRIMRVKHQHPLIIDIIDSHSIFRNQWTKRKTFYQKNSYKIMYTSDYVADKWDDVVKKPRKLGKKGEKANDDNDQNLDNPDIPMGKCFITLD